MNNKIDIDENELLSLLAEDEETVKNLIYDIYGYLINIILAKYFRIIKKLHIDEEEIRCEALYGFSDGINSYLDNKHASLKTFLTLCIERRVLKCIKRSSTKKAYALNETLSLEYEIGEEKSSLLKVVSDDHKYDPLNRLTDIEFYKEVLSIANKNLSGFEYTVFVYMLKGFKYDEIALKTNKTLKQIDNTIQRIKNKLRHEIMS